MIIFTKEVFLNVKALHSVTIRAEHVTSYIDNNPKVDVYWKIHFIGVWLSTNSNSYDLFEQTLECNDKENAYRVYKEVMRQVVESGEFPQLTDKQFDEMLEEKNQNGSI